VKKRISKLLLLSLVLFFGILSSCSQDSDILATSKTKDITRGEFYKWLETKRMQEESILVSKDKQKEILTDMALEIFALDKAKAGGFDKSRRFLIFKEQVRESTLHKYFSREILSKATFNESAIRVSYILLAINRFKQDPDNIDRKIRLEDHEVDRRFDELISKAKGLIQRLDKGESFEKLASEFSEDSTKKSGGDFGYIIRDMMPAYFSEPAFSLKEGEYTKTPVKTPKGVYVIKVEDKVDLTEENIDKIIKDQSQRERIAARLARKFQSDYIEKLMNAEDLEFLYIKGRSYNNTDVIFRIGEKEYTIADVDKNIENRVTQEEKEKIYKNGIVPDKIKNDFAKNMFQYLVWSRDALRLGVDKKPEYLKELEQIENTLLIAEYIRAITSRSVFISDQEILEEYEKGKENRYSEKVMDNGVMVNRAIAFDDVRDEIYNELVKKAQFQRAQEWKEEMIDKYNLKINETELKGT
jgi:foldase protein PrsA